VRVRSVRCRAAGGAPAAAAPAASPSFFAALLKRLKAFATNLAIDNAKDKAGILRLASNFPPKVQGTFTGLFECYVDQARAPRAGAQAGVQARWRGGCFAAAGGAGAMHADDAPSARADAHAPKRVCSCTHAHAHPQRGAGDAGHGRRCRC
jgi:hypothetical protein